MLFVPQFCSIQNDQENTFFVLIEVPQNVLKLKVRDFLFTLTSKPSLLFSTFTLTGALDQIEIINSQQLKNVCLHLYILFFDNYFLIRAFLCPLCITIIVLIAHLVNIVKLVHPNYKSSVVQHFFAARACRF